MMLRLIYKSVENIIYLFSNVCPEPQEFSVNSVQSRLEEIPLSWILGIEQFQELQNEFLIYVAPRYGRLEIL